MKTLHHPNNRKGSATVIVLALLSIMIILETAEFAAARHLDSDLRLIEKRQLQRFNRPSPKHANIPNNHPLHEQS